MQISVRKIKATMVMLICTIAFQSTAFADHDLDFDNIPKPVDLSQLKPSMIYQNLMKSFVIRADRIPQNPHDYFYRTQIHEVKDLMVRSLALIYIYSEMKAHRQIPEELKAPFNFEKFNEAEVLQHIHKSLTRVGTAVRNTHLYNDVVRYYAFNMLIIEMQTLSEFALDAKVNTTERKMNIRDKKLKDILAEQFKYIIASLTGHMDLAEIKDPKDYAFLKPCLTSLETMKKSLTPPGIGEAVLGKIVTTYQSFQKTKASQFETAPMCPQLFF